MDAPEDPLKAEVKNLVVACARLKIPAGQIRNDQPLFDPEKGLGLDSIDVLEIVVNVERAYGAVIPDQETGRQILTSIDTLVDFIRKHGSGPRK